MQGIRFKRVTDSAKLPTRATEHAAGYDIYSAEEKEVLPGKVVMISTGFAMEIPIGYEAQIRPRSGWAAKYGLTVINSPGTIDADFRGGVCVLLINHSDEPFLVKVGERIAQMVFARHETPELFWDDELSETARGSGGFGSTNKP